MFRPMKVSDKKPAVRTGGGEGIHGKSGAVGRPGVTKDYYYGYELEPKGKKQRAPASHV